MRSEAVNYLQVRSGSVVTGEGSALDPAIKRVRSSSDRPDSIRMDYRKLDWGNAQVCSTVARL